MKSSSTMQLRKDGVIDPSHYRDSLIHEWYLRADYQNRLKFYILRESTVDNFLDNSNDGELKVKDRSYSITYISGLSKIRKADKVLISLRYCEYLERGYALVKILEGSGQFIEMEYK